MTGSALRPTLPAGGGIVMKPVGHRWLLVAVLVAACGSSATPGSTTEPAADQGGQTANAPDDAPAPGGGVVAPSVADAIYMSGTTHIEVSGQRTLTADATLVPGASMTTAGTTLLMYGAGEGQEAIVVSIANGPDTGLAMTINAPQIITAGDGSTGCAFEITRNDDAGLAGSFTCRGISTVGLDMATVDVAGSFSAER